MNTHPLINYFVAQGVPFETVKLMFLLPVIAMVIAFLRQVIGIKAFGIYTPSIITFAFLAIGLKYGAAIFTAIILVGMAARYILKKFRLLYLPRMAITISIVTLSMLFILVLGGSLQRTGLAAVSIFPLLIIVTIVEKFVATQIEKGTGTAVYLAAETLVISTVGYYVASWQFLIDAILAFPWLILLTIPVEIFLGKWTGLRLSEYWRFREVFKKI